MSIEAQLRADQTAAMKAKDRQRLNAIRSVQTEVATAKAAPGFSGEVDDELYLQTIATYVKRLGKVKAEYEAIGAQGADRAAAIEFEIDYLSGFLPQKLGEAETRTLVATVIAEMGADADTPAGKVIGAVMKSGQDVDGAVVQRLVNELLAASP